MEGALENAEARADAAEELNETILESARRDDALEPVQELEFGGERRRLAGDAVGGTPHAFSSGSFTEGRLAAKAAA